MSHPGVRAARVVVLVGVLSLLTAACSSGSADDDLPEKLRKITPSESPSAPLVHDGTDSLTDRTVSGDGFTMQVPADFEEQSPTTRSGSTTYRWLKSVQGRQPPIIAVVTDPDPRSDAIEQSKALEISLEADPDVEVVRAPVTWPGAQRAILLQWDQPQPGSDEVVTTWQLMAQVSPDLIMNALAVAPRGEFQDLDFDKILATFTLTG
ncbi:hypothetical protein H9L10_13525 [Phycicoccus endophyticus]|uniref:Lipoprotein n=1 Tax=Phycicoccus endophyticus TaxID=1690220 RepID=A0A7G9R0V3_9MICO|nr:hypothetical protein [Phycicoccus endophyticus]NHI19517.1 hypothetical protein [Phycicoccus endophyticus]QNN49228.1 hypothetical protein H9L10_13525 [Phycicoccus endophyticus]GGL39820.1 hypothetical protein GCM10012283_22880 [Phycicoccus endophyticus]